MAARNVITERDGSYYIEEQRQYAGHWINLRTLSRAFDTNEEALENFNTLVTLGYIDPPIVEQTPKVL